MLECTAESYSQTSQTSKMKLFTKIVNGFHLLTILEKLSILDIWLDSDAPPHRNKEEH